MTRSLLEYLKISYNTGEWLKCWGYLAKYSNYSGFHLLPIPLGEMERERKNKETGLAFSKHQEYMLLRAIHRTTLTLVLNTKKLGLREDKLLKVTQSTSRVRFDTKALTLLVQHLAS